MTLSATILLVTIFVNALLGLSVYIQSKRDRSTFSFFMIITSVFLWAMPLLLYGLTNIEQLALNLSRLSYFAAAMSALALLNFATGFARKSLSSIKKIIVRILNMVIVICFAWLSTSDLLLTGHSVFNSVRTITFGPAYPFYIAFITLVFFVGLFIIGFRHKKETDIVTKKQFLLIFFGILVAIVGGFITNLILPTILNDFSLYWLGPVFTLVMVGFFTISILKYQLFKLKIIATQLFMFLLWIALLIYVVSPAINSIWYKIITLLATISIGILIIRATINDVKRETREKEKEIQHRKEVEKLNKQQESLMKIMNHQIKGYLGKNRSIFAELLTNDYGNLPETAMPLLKEGLEQSAKGVEYVQGILRGASAATGVLPYDIKPMDLRQMVERVITEGKPVAKEKNLSFESNIADGDYNIIGDAVQLSEAFKNLITNAVKYNTPGGSVKVDLRRENEKIIFSVKDTGIGVSDEDKPKLFTFGGMGKNSIKLNVEAAGFGLAFVKGVAEAHKGIGGYKPNDSGKGSTFFVELPVN